MSDLHTLLLVPPDGDTALLADEAGGGRVPWARREHVSGGVHRWVVGAPKDDLTRMCLLTTCALLIVHNGAPVAMGCDRAARAIGALTVARVRREGTGVIRSFAPLGEYQIRGEGPGRPYGLLDLCAAWEAEGARVVALSADGREVTP